MAQKQPTAMPVKMWRPAPSPPQKVTKSLSLDKKEVELLYAHADKELYVEHTGGTLYVSYYVVCPCCGAHNVDEEELENIHNGYKTEEDLITHADDCEFKEYKAVLDKLANYLKGN